MICVCECAKHRCHNHDYNKSCPAGVNLQLDRVFKAAVGFLEEGSLDARTYGKRIIWQVSNPPILLCPLPPPPLPPTTITLCN